MSSPIIDPCEHGCKPRTLVRPQNLTDLRQNLYLV